MKPYKACLFDLDGTLADTLHSIAHFGNGTLGAFGLPAIQPIAYKQLVGNGADVLMDRMLSAVGAALTEEEKKRFRAEYDRRYEADPMALVCAYPGLPYVLADLHEQGLLLGVLSNKPDNMTRAISRALYGDILSQVRGQRAGCPKKPDPAVPLEMAAAWGISPGEILYVGDSGVDMETGRNAGMDACGVLWGFREEKELREHGAVYLAGDPGELKQTALGKGVRI